MTALNLSRLKNKHILVLMGNGFFSAAGFITTFLLFHYLSPHNAGTWFVVQTFVALCEAARYGLLATATVKFYAGAEEDRAKTVLGSVWYLAILLTVIILLLDSAAWLSLPYIHNYEATLCIKWVGITYLSSLPADVIFWKLQAEEKYNSLFWYRVFTTSSTVIAFALLILFHQMTLEHALLYNLVANFICSITGVALGISGLQYIFKRTKACVREIFNYGKFTLGTTSCSVLLGNADTWIVNVILGPTAVAIYNLAMRLMQFIDLPLRTFITTGMSEMAIHFNHKNMQQVSYIFKKYAGMLTIAFIPAAAGAYLIADVATILLGGHKYLETEANELYQLLMIIAILYPIDRFNGLTLDIIHKEKANFYKVIAMLVAKVAGTVIFIYVTGSVFGVAAGHLVSTLTGVIVGYFLLRKHVPHTLPGIVTTGWQETKLLIRKRKQH